MAATAENSLISIVMLCYNHARYVDEALDGLLAQTYSPLDIVIVDDCSQDRTAKIVAKRLSMLRNRADIRFIRNPRNLGLLGARETGFRAARGSFIVDTCDDDAMLPDMVAEMAEAWRSRNVSLITANAEYIDHQSNTLGRTARDPGAPADDSFETLARDGANACCFGASIGFEREVFTTFGMPPAHLDNLDIMLPFYAYLLKGAHFITKPLLKYRVHGQNASLSLTAERSSEVERLQAHERIFSGHLAHAVVMLETIARLGQSTPQRHDELLSTIVPLLNVQVIEMARKLTKTRAELHARGAPVKKPRRRWWNVIPSN